MSEEIKERTEEIKIENVSGNTLDNKRKYKAIIASIVLLLSLIFGFSLDEQSVNLLSEILYKLLQNLGL